MQQRKHPTSCCTPTGGAAPARAVIRKTPSETEQEEAGGEAPGRARRSSGMAEPAFAGDRAVVEENHQQAGKRTFSFNNDGN